MPDADDLLLPVPEFVGATYIVAVPRPVDDPAAPLRAITAWPAPISSAVTALLERGTVVVRPMSAVTPLPLALLAASGATEAQVRRLRTATHAIIVAAGGRPGWPPIQDWATRAVAARLADAFASDVLDVGNHQVFAPDRATATLPDDAGRVRLADWLQVAYSPDSSGYWVTTTGLGRFGLPELQTLAAPPSNVEQWGQAMTGIGAAVLARWTHAIDLHPDSAFVTLPANLTIAREDVAAAYRRGDLPMSATGPAQVRLALDPGFDADTHAFLTIHPPLDWPGSAGEHVAEVCASLFGPRTSDIRHAHRGELMDQAIATARAGLTGIRRRFEAGDLDLRTKLLVKYALPADEGTEYLWAYVTSWRDPYRILATSAADAIYHPKVRTGRPVVVDTASVVDWAVEHDQRGIVEGYWTKAAVED